MNVETNIPADSHTADGPEHVSVFRFLVNPKCSWHSPYMYCAHGHEHYSCREHSCLTLTHWTVRCMRGRWGITSIFWRRVTASGGRGETILSPRASWRQDTWVKPTRNNTVTERYVTHEVYPATPDAVAADSGRVRLLLTWWLYDTYGSRMTGHRSPREAFITYISLH